MTSYFFPSSRNSLPVSELQGLLHAQKLHMLSPFTPLPAKLVTGVSVQRANNAETNKEKETTFEKVFLVPSRKEFSKIINFSKLGLLWADMANHLDLPWPGEKPLENFPCCQGKVFNGNPAEFSESVEEFA